MQLIHTREATNAFFSTEFLQRNTTDSALSASVEFTSPVGYASSPTAFHPNTHSSKSWYDGIHLPDALLSRRMKLKIRAHNGTKPPESRTILCGGVLYLSQPGSSRNAIDRGNLSRFSASCVDRIFRMQFTENLRTRVCARTPNLFMSEVC